MKTKATALISSAACAVVLSVGASSAATVSLSAAPGLNAFGAPNYSETVTRVISPTNPNGGTTGTSNLSAGMFRLMDGLNEILAFCLEPGKALTLNATFNTATAPNISTARLSAVKDLYNTAYTSVNDASTAAAFQLAIWEIAAEDDASSYDLSSGQHSITSWSGSTRATAQGFLNGLNGPATGSYAFTTYTNDGQDLISVAPVPLPAAGFMLVAALGGLGAMRRLRKS